MDMKKLITVCVGILLLSACAQNAPNMTMSSKTAATNFRNATAIGFDEVIPTQGAQHVSVHAFSNVSRSTCDRVLSLAFSSHHTYPQTIIALKNRAAILGANAIAVTNWIESSTHMYMDAHFFECASKKYL